MTFLPPHLIDESIEEKEKKDLEVKKAKLYGRQGPSKYGKGDSRAHKALGPIKLSGP